MKVLFKKGASKIAAKNVSSPIQAQRLSRAVKNLQDTDLDNLIASGVVKKLSLNSNSRVYSYRASNDEWIVFTPTEDANIVLDIIDLRSNRSILTPKTKKGKATRPIGKLRT